jgi:hypothetical protein
MQTIKTPSLRDCGHQDSGLPARYGGRLHIDVPAGKKTNSRRQQELQSGGEKAGRHFPVIGEGAMTINEMLDELG